MDKKDLLTSIRTFVGQVERVDISDDGRMRELAAVSYLLLTDVLKQFGGRDTDGEGN